MNRSQSTRDQDAALERTHALTRARIARRLGVLEARGQALVRAVSSAEKRVKKVLPVAAAVLLVGVSAFAIWRARRRPTQRALFSRSSRRARGGTNGSLLSRFATNLALTAARHVISRAVASWAESAQQKAAASHAPRVPVGHDGV